MRTTLAIAAALLAACTPPPDDRPAKKEPGPTDTAVTDTATDTGPTDTGPTDTGPTTPPFDCGDVPVPPFKTGMFDIQTEEDFDFDKDGYLIHQNGVDLVGVDMTGAFKVIMPNAAQDPAGIQVLSTGDIAVASPETSSLRLVDAVNGGFRTLVSNVGQINGIEIDSNDRIYYSEMTTDGRIGWVDPYTGAQGLVLDHVYQPNGLALSPDEQTLYMTGGISADDSYVFAVDAVGPDQWSAPRVVLTAVDDTFAAIEVDSCGYVYTIGFTGGNVLRTFPQIEVTEVIGNLKAQGGWGWFGSMRFGNGIGGWERDTLYVTNRQNVFRIDVNVPGRPHPSNPVP